MPQSKTWEFHGIPSFKLGSLLRDTQQKQSKAAGFHVPSWRKYALPEQPI
jgi:hypothetical protein